MKKASIIILSILILKLVCRYHVFNSGWIVLMFSIQVYRYTHAWIFGLYTRQFMNIPKKYLIPSYIRIKNKKLLSVVSHWLWQIKWHWESNVFNWPLVVLPQTAERGTSLQGHWHFCWSVLMSVDTSKL